MQTFIIFLRGINVSGQKLIKMAELRKKLEALGLHSVRTYIQSGNIVVRSEEDDPEKLEDRVKSMLMDQYGWDVGVLVKLPEELEKVLEVCPHLKEEAKDRKKIYFTLLNKEPESGLVDALRAEDYSPEEWILIDQTIHFYSPNGYGRAKMNNNFFEKKLKVGATTRNLNTLRKMVDWAGEA